jgi:hypothetical protein
LFTRLKPRRVQISLSRHSPRRSPPNYHHYWYLRDLPTDKSQKDVARWREVRGEEDSGNSPPSPCSLADLEDQRWSILDDERDTDPIGNTGRVSSLSKVRR